MLSRHRGRGPTKVRLCLHTSPRPSGSPFPVAQSPLLPFLLLFRRPRKQHGSGGGGTQNRTNHTYIFYPADSVKPESGRHPLPPWLGADCVARRSGAFSSVASSYPFVNAGSSSSSSDSGEGRASPTAASRQQHAATSATPPPDTSGRNTGFPGRLLGVPAALTSVRNRCWGLKGIGVIAATAHYTLTYVAISLAG